MESFDEYSEKSQEIANFMEMVLVGLTQNYEVTLKEPAHDIASRFLNEIAEFKPLQEVADNKEKDVKIKELEETSEKALSLIERLLNHVTQEAIYTGILQRKIEELMDDVHGPDPEKR